MGTLSVFEIYSENDSYPELNKISRSLPWGFDYEKEGDFLPRKCLRADDIKFYDFKHEMKSISKRLDFPFLLIRQPEDVSNLKVYHYYKGKCTKSYRGEIKLQ